MCVYVCFRISRARACLARATNVSYGVYHECDDLGSRQITFMSRCCITAASSLRLSRVQGAKVHEIIPIISVAIIADGVGVS